MLAKRALLSLRSRDRRVQQLGEADPVQKLLADTVHNRERDA